MAPNNSFKPKPALRVRLVQALETMSRHNLIPKLCALALLTPFVYYWVYARWPHPWEGNFGERIDWDTIMFQVVPSIAIFTNLILGLHRSVRMKDYVWTAAMLLLFPLGFWYTLFTNRGLGSNNSFKPKPLRGST